MATVKGVNRTKADNPISDNILSGGQFGGRVRCMIDTYEASTVADGTIIEMGGDLPVGAVVVAGVMTWDAFGGSRTISIGDAEDPDRYVVTEDVSSAGQTFFDAITGQNYQITMATAVSAGTPDNQVLLTIAGGTVNGTIEVAIFYTTD